jgi:hypothetical protein
MPTRRCSHDVPVFGWLLLSVGVRIPDQSLDKDRKGKVRVFSPAGRDKLINHSFRAGPDPNVQNCRFQFLAQRFSHVITFRMRLYRATGTLRIC